MLARLVVSTAALALAAWGQPGHPAQLVTSSAWSLNEPVLNRPFSATAVAHISHTLEDGTHINQSTTTVMYRDAQGRRRNETDGVIDIDDPVSHKGIQIDPSTSTAVKRTVDGYIVPEQKLAPLPVKAFESSEGAKKKGAGGKSAANRNVVVTENLGLQTINGVLAYGVRTSLTIPAGAIGNDRDIKSVKETWTSAELHLLVKSIDSDPRFGTSTYELTNIIQAAPDATLFQIQAPPGYTVRSQQNFQLQVR